MAGSIAPHATVASVEDVLALLRARGGRVTGARRLLIGALFASGEHRGAEELAAVVQSDAPDVHLSTIYRNLEELERLGVVVHTHFGHGPATYHLAGRAHAHFVCEGCGQALEAPDELLGPLVDAAREAMGFEVDRYHFAIPGRCAACRAGVAG